MAFVDELTIHAEAGKGGDGVVRWRHEKGKEFSGAAGGNGGKGGDVYFIGVRDIGLLATHAHEKMFKAGNADAGQNNSRQGKDGEDLFIKVPVGSIIKNVETGKEYRIDEPDQKVLVLKGGRGGLGNEHFKASTNTTPKESTPGKEGETGEFYIELELVADAGFAGLPNAGKSSLLNALTNAKSKVAAYQFTTLEPALGNMEGFILADIPGLIEGASEGKGLGIKFLRHIRRTKIILHCISFEVEDFEETYNTIRKELETFDEELGKKEEIIILTKTDVTTPDVIKEREKFFKKLGKPVFTVTVLDDESVKDLKDNLIKILRKV
ncbi:MAG: obgE [Candidatus Paceibacter sp.]|jgi:GTP-binding protein|nr:obgE [Candidatus Paceibacter sp.]